MQQSVESALEIIRHHPRVAVVGISPKTDRPSHRVARFLLEQGFEIIPINPVQKRILNKPCVGSLSELNANDVDWLDFFVAPGRLMGFAENVIRLSPKLVWCQIGVVSEAFNRKLAAAGIPYIADVCPKMEWKEDWP